MLLCSYARLCIPPEFRGIPLNSFLLDLKGTESCFPFRGMQKGTRREIPSVTKSYEIVSGGARPPGNGPSRKEHQRILTNIRGRTRLSIYRTGQDNGTSTASRSPAVRARRPSSARRRVVGPPPPPSAPPAGRGARTGPLPVGTPDAPAGAAPVDYNAVRVAKSGSAGVKSASEMMSARGNSMSLGAPPPRPPRGGTFVTSGFTRFWEPAQPNAIGSWSRR